jgi:hypothetical protein
MARVREKALDSPDSEVISANSGVVALVVTAWLIIAVVVGYTRVLESLPRPLGQVVLLACTAALLAAYFAVSTFRRWVDGLPLRALIAIHLTRFVGFYFLYLYGDARLPYDFAVVGGIGDVAIAVGAAVLIFMPGNGRGWRRAVLVWNALGLIDILYVVSTAARSGLADPGSMIELTRLPLSLLPTFIVPLIIASHIVVFVRLGSQGRRDTANAQP